ncbi:MAG: Gll1135 protein [uncultured Solirubrobacteraceae bacterium]|uniref:Gll1135 protein n=1 Tax=uncultured Solirubrobacteraceae bacterium TaxID=1162706 RepID=A0A6J4SWL7_9ACTN|nr:MAG: Gll1135 protein [uncultured Solirubrobacteraceae bacterium]
MHSSDLETPEPMAAVDDGETVLVLGAGPAGLTAAYALAKRGRRVLVLEAEDQVGGLAKTVVKDGYRFDLGGHRFFTKVQAVDALWHEVLDDEFLLRRRMSRIYWNQRFLDYPLRGGDVIRKLGPIELTRSVASYLVAAARPKRQEDTFEQWVSNRFGKRLFHLFFESYTEKVWGVPTSEIRAEWAAQRIKGLSFLSAAKAAFVGNEDNNVKSLIDRFHYPRYGPGQMWDAMTREIEALGGEVRLRAPVEQLCVHDGRVTGVKVDGEILASPHVISSLPLRTTVGMVDPPAPTEIEQAARGLRYRDFLTVALILDGADLFPDNWIYIHEPAVQVGRIQNYRSWSEWMVPDRDKSCVGMEYFCFEGDELWTMSDDELVALATRELAALNLADAGTVRDGHVVRVPKAYPMYDAAYAERIGEIRGWLRDVPNLIQIGRNGLHRYNNSDHSSLTALRAVENLLDGAGHDIWAVNADSAYHEEDVADEQPYREAPTTPAMNKPLADVSG